MHVTALARSAFDLDAIANSLSDGKLDIHTPSRYYVGAPQRAGMIFGYAITDAPDIDRLY